MKELHIILGLCLTINNSCDGYGANMRIASDVEGVYVHIFKGDNTILDESVYYEWPNSKQGLAKLISLIISIIGQIK